MAANQAPYDAQASTNYKEAFALFDKRGNQRVQVESLGDLLRACGQNPTLSEIRDLEKNVGGDCMFFLFRLEPLNSLAHLGQSSQLHYPRARQLDPPRRIWIYS